MPASQWAPIASGPTYLTRLKTHALCSLAQRPSDPHVYFLPSQSSWKWHLYGPWGEESIQAGGRPPLLHPLSPLAPVSHSGWSLTTLCWGQGVFDHWKPLSVYEWHGEMQMGNERENLSVFHPLGLGDEASWTMSTTSEEGQRSGIHFHVNEDTSAFKGSLCRPQLLGPSGLFFPLLTFTFRG